MEGPQRPPPAQRREPGGYLSFRRMSASGSTGSPGHEFPDHLPQRQAERQGEILRFSRDRLFSRDRIRAGISMVAAQLPPAASTGSAASGDPRTQPAEAG